MTRSDAEQHLLAGTLAFQIGLIDQNALESSIQSWSHDKSKDLSPDPGRIKGPLTMKARP